MPKPSSLNPNSTKKTHFLDSNIPNNSPPNKKTLKSSIKTKISSCIHIQTLDIPLLSNSTNHPLQFLFLEPKKPHTIGRKRRLCDSVFDDKRVSKQHCQLFFDSFSKKLFVSDGVYWFSSCGFSEKNVSLNGVFVNGVRVVKGGFVELGVGDEVALVCGKEYGCELGFRVGFRVRKIDWFEEVFDRKGDAFRENNVSFESRKDCLVDKKDAFLVVDSVNSGYNEFGSEGRKKIARLKFLLGQCRRVLDSDDPVNCIRNGICLSKCSSSVLGNVSFVVRGANEPENGILEGDKVESSLIVGDREEKVNALGVGVDNNRSLEFERAEAVENNVVVDRIEIVDLDPEHVEMLENNVVVDRNRIEIVDLDPEYVEELENNVVVDRNKIEIVDLDPEHEEKLENNVVVDGIETVGLDPIVREDGFECHMGVNNANNGVLLPSPGNKFYLNRLQTMGVGSSGYQNSVSLPELLYPVETLQQIFIATFTSDIPWFISYCEIPAHIPVTIACHNRDRCWSSSSDERSSKPFPDFPHLVVVYPPFPEAIAFGNDRKNLGIACHHPKLFVLQREDSIRVVITSANLVSKQWNKVTNTVWWQDFPRTNRPDYLSLFTQISGEIYQDTESDFAAQLAGFMATLIADVPNQAHWITELTKYDFKGAKGHLVASVPGIHSQRVSSAFESMYFSSGKQCESQADAVKALGSIETFVVGLSHLFRSSTDSNGAQLKKLASFIQNCHENSNGMLEVVLKRNTHIPADINAVSVLVPNPKEFLVEDWVQLGFLPRHAAKWVAPLLDCGLFRFFGFVYPKQVLATALEGSTSKVHMLLYVSKGSSFPDISTSEYVRHHPAICALIASIQRSTGIWRLDEVLSRYKWPENLETDFVFGSSSIGAVNAQFLAAFSAAVGKTSVQIGESEESDPYWGCWSASQEMMNPSMRIIFPTIDRVKSASCGIMASRRMLCFSQKTWYRLRNVDILHDAIPFPRDRVNNPMHVKVARRRFKSKTDASSFGWVYCGSHNFSAAAWGRPLSNSVKTMGDTAVKTRSVLGSRLHISNYEIGILFIVPPSDTKTKNLDDIVMPFVVPAPKYQAFDRPATPQAMKEAYKEVIRLQERITFMEDVVAEECIDEEIPNEEEEILEASYFIVEEKADEKAYADALWSQVESSQSC